MPVFGGGKTEANSLCPFSWTAQESGCFLSKSVVWKPAQCLGAPCKLWDPQRNDCGIKTGFGSASQGSKG